MSAKPDIITAAVLVIGDEILSGRTKDKNIGYIADYLSCGFHYGFAWPEACYADLWKASGSKTGTSFA